MLPPPRPEWPFDKCKEKYWMKRGDCLLPKCRWKHVIPEPTDEEVKTAQASSFGSFRQIQSMERNFGPRNPNIWLGNYVNEVSSDKALEGKVLLDT